MHKRAPIPLACALACALALTAGTAAAQDTAAADAAPAADGAAAKSDAKSDASKLETVYVSASKRRERLQDAPLAITALGAETMERLGVTRFTDYMTLVPNLTQAGTTVVMRGLYTGSQQTTNTTAFYVGESPFTSSGSLAVGALVTPDPDLVDVARIEVLKGPQGTLYGATALGGLIRIVPQEPDLHGFGGSVRLGASATDHGGPGHSERVSLNVPLSDRIGLLVSAFDRKDGGYTTNTKTGTNDLGWTKASGGSVSALAKLTNDWKVTLRLLSQKRESLGSAYQDNLQSTGTPLTGEYQYSAAVDAPNTSRYRLTELSTEYVTPVGTLTASVNRVSTRMKLTADYTPAYGVYVAPYLPAGFSLLGDLDVNLKSKQGGEIRFATTRLGNFEGVAGLFYTDEDNEYDTALSSHLASGAVAPAPFGNFLTSLVSSKYREEAAFINGSYYLTPAFDIGAGVRYARNQQHAEIRRSGLLASSTAPTIVDFDDASTTWQATARWRPTQELSTFLRYSTGYRPGGPQTNANPPPGTPATFKPDTVANTELGIKGTALDRRLSFDASIYHIDWKDVQLNGLSGGTLLLANAGKARVNGLEAQLSYLLQGNVQIGANIGFNDAKLTEVGTATAAYLGAAAGDRLPGSSKVTAAAFGDWSFPVGDMTGSLGATLRYQGAKPSSFPGSALNPNYNIPAYTQLDLRAGLEWSRYQLRLRLDNATDKLAYTSYSTAKVAAAQTVASNAGLIRPRTITLTFGADF
ncbi:TonB-dependent receptor [Pelomonas sp. KK5]|uniref:TonB-dependent receptor n=1 Tax=Pelomonas sp. KK5 TaxID=1855730 RepID=UPI0009FA35EA|nr:TonB-dependent receptor [Pelomonas sp. KK5]